MTWRESSRSLELTPIKPHLNMNTPEELRKSCAAKLRAAAESATKLAAFVGLDGFVDEIIHVVDTRESSQSFKRLPTITKMAERLASAAGRSTNIELVNYRTKLGGNGPIMANALATFGIKVTYLGSLGYPNIHPVFEPFTRQAEVYSIAEPGHTDALEFEDGKIMFGKSISLNDITWATIQERFGKEKFISHFDNANLVGFVNWTMIPFMSEIWESLLREVCPGLKGERQTIFFDLADPAKRSVDDILKALKLISQFEKYFKVILGLNEKESSEIAAAYGLTLKDRTPAGLANLARELQHRLMIETVVIHPVTYALAVDAKGVETVQGPYIAKPLITTGAGDHFNAGFCLGKLLNFSNEESLLTGVSTSGFYVRNARSPSMLDLASLMSDWPAA